MNFKHNKKRNTAFLFEAIIKEISEQVLEGNDSKKKRLVLILKEFFYKNSILSRELEAYRSIYEEKDSNEQTLDKIILESKNRFDRVNRKEVFNEQTKLISRLNSIDKEIFNNFIKNYKVLASINQLFISKDKDLKVKDRISLQEQIKEFVLTKPEQSDGILEEVDSIVYRNFIEKFNNEYSSLLAEQKDLLKHYIYILADEEEKILEFQIFLSNEIKRLKKIVSQSLLEKEIKSDQYMVEKTQKVMEILNSYSQKHINESDFEKILVIQELAKEITSNGDQDQNS
jgi:hypothetical protein